MSIFLAYIRLIRPLNLAITLLGVVLGGVLSGGFFVLAPEPDDSLILASLAAVLIAAGGNAINDLFDAEVDRINRPDRPIPSGYVSLGGARLVWLALTAAGVGISAFVSSPHVIMSGAAAAALYAYSRHLKGTAFIGNAVVSLLVALALVFGGWATGSPEAAMIGAGFAFLTTFARESVKDIQDVSGDVHAGVRTAAGRVGIDATAGAAAAALIITVLLTPLPFLFLRYSALYLLIVLLADVLLLRALWLLPKHPEEAGAPSAWLKGAMTAGMAALFAAEATF